VTTSANTPRWLSAALVDGDGDDAASMLVSIIEGPFKAAPATRDELSSAVVRHFTNELGVKFQTERVEWVSAPTPRIEVFGSVRAENQVRHVLVASLSGEGRHAVVVFTAPSGRWDEIAGAARASLDSFRNDAPQGAELPRGVAFAVAAVLAALLTGSLWLWRRRRKPAA